MSGCLVRRPNRFENPHLDRSGGVVCKSLEAALTVAGFLLAIPLDTGRVCLTILVPVVGVLFAPLACALPACLGVVRIDCDLLSAVAGTALPLAAGLTTDGLRRLTSRRDKGLVAIRAPPLDHR